jgi:hypothetical protein
VRLFGKVGEVSKSTEKLLKEIAGLEPAEFMGVCTILGIDVYKEKKTEEDTTESGQPNGSNVEGAPSTDDTKIERVPKDFNELWNEVCDEVDGLNRVRRRNLDCLLRPIYKKGKKK